MAALASFIFSPLTERLAYAYDWRAAVGILALILAAVTVPLHAVVLRPSPEQRPFEAHLSPIARGTVREAAFWLLVTAFVLSSFTSAAVGVHLVTLLIDGGRSAALAAFAAGVMGLAQIPGRAVFALSYRLLGRARTTALIFGSASAAFVLLIAANAAWVGVAFAVAFGMSNGMVTLLRATLIGDLYGTARYGVVSGTVNAFVLATRAAAPVAAAMVALAPGGYTTLLVVLAVFSAAAGLAASAGLRSSTASQPAADGEEDLGCEKGQGVLEHPGAKRHGENGAHYGDGIEAAEGHDEVQADDVPPCRPPHDPAGMDGDPEDRHGEGDATDRRNIVATAGQGCGEDRGGDEELSPHQTRPGAGAGREPSTTGSIW
jgi:Major Facilitator Superfamily